MEALWRKGVGCLVPFDDAAKAQMKRWKIGDTIAINAKRPRNARHHAKFQKLVDLVYENQDHYEQREHFVAALKTALGHCDLIEGKGGKMIAIPKSISFAKMGQDEFDDFYSRALDLIAKHFLPGVETDALRAEVESFF